MSVFLLKAVMKEWYVSMRISARLRIPAKVFAKEKEP